MQTVTIAILVMVVFIIVIIAMRKDYCDCCGRLLHVSRLYIKQANLESSRLDKYICRDCIAMQKKQKTDKPKKCIK